MLIFGLIVRGENHGLAGGLETNWLTPETLGSVVKPSCTPLPSCT